MTSEHKENRYNTFTIFSVMSVVVFLSLVFTITPFTEVHGGGPTGVTSFDNLGSLGSNADAFYFQDNIPSNFVQNLTGIVNEAVLQNGTSSLDSQGEIRLGDDSTLSQWNFLHKGNEGSNLTSIVLWTNGDIEGEPEYPLIDTLDAQAGQENGFFLATITGDNFLLSIFENNKKIMQDMFFGTSYPIDDDGSWHMITLIMDKGNMSGTGSPTSQTMAIICVDGSSNCAGHSSSITDFFDGQGSDPDHEFTIGSDHFSAAITENTFNVDELTIWNGYQLTPANIDAMWNGGSGASSIGIGDSFQVVRHTFDTAQAQFGGSPDTDSDGIFNEVDDLPNTFSDDFSDLSLGGTSDGSIIVRGDQVLEITEEPNPDGVRVNATSGTTPATIEFCSGMTSIDFDAGDESIQTCSSVTVTVINGTLSITFIATDDTEATTSLTQGNTITFDQDTFSFTAPATNTETITISKDGENTPLEPSSTVSIPLQTANPDSDPTVRWVNGIGDAPCTDLNTFNCVDETLRDDSDYIQTIGLGRNTSDKQFYTLSDITDPMTSSGHVLRYTIQEADLGVNPVKLDVILRQGETVIASFHHENLPTGFTLIEQTLTSVQADSITDYSDLELTFDGNCDSTCKNSPGNREKIQVSWIEFAIMASS